MNRAVCGLLLAGLLVATGCGTGDDDGAGGAGGTNGSAGAGGGSAGAGGTGGAGGDGGGAATGGAGGGHAAAPTFGEDVWPIVLSTCMGYCHAGSQPPNFSQGMESAYDELTTGRATCDDAPYVVAGQPDDSYLVMKIEGAAGICGVRMPKGVAPLSASEITTIRDWIEGGAHE